MSIENAKRAVSDIDKYGDVIDERRSKSPIRRYILKGVIAQPLAIGSASALLDIDKPSVPVAASVLVSTVVGGIYYAKNRKMREASHIEAFHEDNHEARGDNPELPVDIIASDDGNAILYHEQPILSREAKDDGDEKEADYRTEFDPTRMRQVANHAQDIGIDRIVFEVTHDVHSKLPADKLRTLDDWLTENKSRKTELSSVYSEGLWVEQSAVELHQLANEVEREDVLPQIERYVDMLRVRGHSNIPNQFDRYKSGEMSMEVFLRLVDHEFCTEGQETVLHHELDRLSGEHRIVKEGSYLTRKGDSVTEVSSAYDGTSTRVQSRTLLAIVGARDREDLRVSLEDVIDYNHEVDQRARVALMLTLLGNSSADAERKDESVESMFDAIKRRDEFRFEDQKTYRRRQIGAAAYTASLFALAIFAPQVVSGYAEDSSTTMHRLYESQSPALRGSQSYEEFVSQVNSIQAAAAQIEDGRRKLVTGFVDTVDPNRIFLPESDEYRPGSFVDGGIGDVRHLDGDKEILSVKGLNGASTEGYWGQYAAEQLIVPIGYGNGYKYDAWMENFGANDNGQEQPAFINLPMDNSELINTSKPHIEVSQKINPRDATLISRRPLAVKQGTELFAAAFILHNEGKNYILPVSAYRNVDNEWYIKSVELDALVANGTTYDDAEFKYWLSEGKGESLRADSPLIVSDGRSPGVAIDDIDTSQTAKSLGEDPLYAIRQKNYSLTPLSDEGADSSASSYATIDDYGKMLATLDSANCNTATTSLLLATKGHDYDGKRTNPALGYYNDGDNKLSVREAHMWAVNENGEVIDPTPSSGAALQIGSHEGSINWFEAIKYGSAAALIGGLAVMGYRKRRSFVDAAHAVRNAAARRSDKLISQKPKTMDGELVGRLQHALYADPDSKHVPQVIEVSRVDKTLDTLPSVSYKEALKLSGKLSLSEKLRLGKLVLAMEYRAHNRFENPS